MPIDMSKRRDPTDLPLIPIPQPFEGIRVALAAIDEIRRVRSDLDWAKMPGRPEALAVQRALGPAAYTSRSYAGAFLLVGAGTRPVGVDLEISRAIPDPEIPRHLLSAAENGMVRADPTAFFRIWTLKEAVAKAQGRGIDESFAAIDVAPAAAAPPGGIVDLGMASVVHMAWRHRGRELIVAVAIA